jgi:VWFA-related protein
MRGGRAIPCGLAAMLAAAAVVFAGQAPPTTYLVEIDAVVTDDAGKPVTGLEQSDFQIRDDGKAVDVKTFEEVRDSDDRPVARSIVVLLDDSGLGAGNTLPMQQIARMFVARMQPPDEFSVIRLNNRRDEAFGDRLEALLRIEEYRSDALPFFGLETVENALRSFARVARTLEAIEHRRKALVCVGIPEVCSIPEPSGKTSLLWRFWIDTMGAMGRSNASVYSVEPNGASRKNPLRGGSIADVTGGQVFINTSDLTRPIDVVRRDTGNYYLLGYWPLASDKPLHSVDVKVTKRGAHVRARRVRGESS